MHHMQQPQRNGRGLRIVIDTSLLLSTIALAFWTGKLYQKVEGMQVPGGVPISIEARERLTKIETEIVQLRRDLDAKNP